jgi:hypothetical protein
MICDGGNRGQLRIYSSASIGTEVLYWSEPLGNQAVWGELIWTVWHALQLVVWLFLVAKLDMAHGERTAPIRI